MFWASVYIAASSVLPAAAPVDQEARLPAAQPRHVQTVHVVSQKSDISDSTASEPLQAVSGKDPSSFHSDFPSDSGQAAAVIAKSGTGFIAENIALPALASQTERIRVLDKMNQEDRAEKSPYAFFSAVSAGAWSISSQGGRDHGIPIRPESESLDSQEVRQKLCIYVSSEPSTPFCAAAGIVHLAESGPALFPADVCLWTGPSCAPYAIACTACSGGSTAVPSQRLTSAA